MGETGVREEEDGKGDKERVWVEKKLCSDIRGREQVLFDWLLGRSVVLMIDR